MREPWLVHAKNLDWKLSYVGEEEAYPPPISGTPWLPREAWAAWEQPYKTTYEQYVSAQSSKNDAVETARELVGRAEDLRELPLSWQNALKLHFAVFSLAEFAAVVGNLRAARFGRDPAWRNAALLGALDELRHTQIPLLAAHELVRYDAQFDWTHRLYHSNHWVAIAARHVVDELLLASDPIEFAVGANFVFETAFTNLQFIALSSAARATGDRMFAKMVNSIQSDEARHAQIGPAVLRIIVEHDKKRAQELVDKWFWRSWPFFAIASGFSMDYLTAVEHRTQSFKEFMEEWVIDQYLRSLEELGLEPPWYWDDFVASLDHHHHMLYVSAYTYRASLWFDVVMPGPKEHAWLEEKYPESWPSYAKVWGQIADRWREADAGNDLAVHGTAIPAFCELCQVVLAHGTPERNDAVVHLHEGEKFIFCSEPCRYLFKKEPQRYAKHKNVVKRVLAGEAPGNLVALLKNFGLDFGIWGKDVHRGAYPWLEREKKK